MPDFPIITTLVTAFGLALVFGWFSERFLKTPALVGYIIAGVSVSLFPWLPEFNRAATEQFAELGVILLMFGVGLHFSVGDLVKVKGVAVTGALVQMTVSSLAGCAIAVVAWDWALPAAIVFGLTLSCASTVVVTKALELRHLTSDMNGQVAIGWLVVQDLVTVFIMVCLPLLAQVTLGEGTLDAKALVISLSKTMLSLIVFVAGMLIIGRRVFPWILAKVAEAGSRELFTLCVLALAIGIAYGAGAIFNVSFALGAFFAGMVMRESSFARQAAKNSLPLQDAFAVLFFVSVGLMLDWHIFLNEPLAVLAVVLVIMLVTSTVGMLLVVGLGWPLDMAMILGACLAQVGEFSFILCGQGIDLGLVTSETMSLIVAASIMTIALNPIMFALIPRNKRFLVGKFDYMRRAGMREAPMSTLPAETPRRLLRGHVVIAGTSEVVRSILPMLAERRIPVVCFAEASEVPAEATGEGVKREDQNVAYIVGDPSDPMMLVKAHMMTAAMMVLPSHDLILNKTIIAIVRELRPDMPIVVRAHTLEDAEHLESTEDDKILVICDVAVASNVLSEKICELFGLTQKEELDEEFDNVEAYAERKAIEAEEKLKNKPSGLKGIVSSFKAGMDSVKHVWGDKKATKKNDDKGDEQRLSEGENMPEASAAADTNIESVKPVKNEPTPLASEETSSEAALTVDREDAPAASDEAASKDWGADAVASTVAEAVTGESDKIDPRNEKSETKTAEGGRAKKRFGFWPFDRKTKEGNK